jgi:hypothetical protein
MTTADSVIVDAHARKRAHVAQEIVDGACARSELFLGHRLRRLAGERTEDHRGDRVAT